MTHKEALQKLKELDLPDGWKLNVSLIKHNREAPIDSTQILFDSRNGCFYAKLSREGNIYEDVLDDSIEALELLLKLIKG